MTRGKRGLWARDQFHPSITIKKQTNHVTNLHMPRQLICRDSSAVVTCENCDLTWSISSGNKFYMCQITVWSGHYFSRDASRIFITWWFWTRQVCEMVCRLFQQLDTSLQWRHNGCDGVSNHRRLHCLLYTVGSGTKKTSKLRITGLCAGN